MAAADREQIETVDIRQLQDVGDFITPIGQRPHMYDLGLFPVEHAEEFLHGEELTVGTGNRDDRHGAAGTFPYRC